MTQQPMMLGVPEMDDDHLAIAALFDRIEAAPDADLPSLLVEAEQAVTEHFAHEEELMARHDVPVLFCHIAQHKKLLGEFSHAHAALAAGRVEELGDLLRRIIPDLIIAHVASVDRVTSMWLTGALGEADVSGLRLPDPAPACG